MNASPSALGATLLRRPLDAIYVAAAGYDMRFTRICIASIRYFYPDIPIRLLPGGSLPREPLRELSRYWNVDIADVPAGNYGWGFVKLEPLFGPAGERFLVLDSDTVMTGPVLDLWAECDADFLVDNESQPESKTRGLYFDWDKLVAAGFADAAPPAFVFNTGQWFGTAGVIARDDFSGLVRWSMPPTLEHSECFMPGDQGVLNFVLNRKFRDGVTVGRCKLMHWPGYGMGEISARAIEARTAPPFIVHWAGVKKLRMRQMSGFDVLMFFERFYYKRIFAGHLRRVGDISRDVVVNLSRQIRLRLRLRMNLIRYGRLDGARS